MHKDDDIISFDLYRGGQQTLDVTSFFRVSELHAIRVEKPSIDTILARRPRHLDLTLPSILTVSEYSRYDMLDIAVPALAYRRGLHPAPDGATRGSVIDLFPPLSPPYGALDVRGEPMISDQKYGDIYRRSLPWSLHARRVVRDTSRYLRKQRKPITLTLMLALGLTVPILFYTKYLIETGYAELAAIKTVTNRADIVHHIHSARTDFERANILFLPLSILPGDSISLANAALYGGLSLTRGLDQIIGELPTTGSGDTIVDSSEEATLFRPIAKNIYPLQSLGISNPTVWMREHRSTVEYLARMLEEAGEQYSSIEDIDHPRAHEIAHVGRGIREISSVVSFYLDHESDALALLGADTPERYIIFNQNRDEIRANGGFPGTVITFTLFRGNIEDYRTDDVYYYDWNLYPYKEMPPPGLALISGNYGLRDVNYYADFRQTLEKANAFIEKSGDPTVTVGIALHQGLIEDILGKIGPVSLTGVTEPFVKENFSLLMSTLVESRYGEETSAKDILRKFVDAFVEKIHDTRSYEEVIQTIKQSLSDGEIVFASRNDKIDAFFSKYKKPLPWQAAGDAPTTLSGDAAMTLSGDTLALRNWAYPLLTSLGGNKSDRWISREYSAVTQSLSACQYLDTLTFAHRHTYNRDKERQIRSYLTMLGIGDSPTVEKMLAIQGNGINKSYIRLLVPPGATLTGATAGVDVMENPYAREFAFSLDTPVGGMASKTIRYTVTLPGCSPTPPLVTWYRQPGLKDMLMQAK